MTARGLSPVVVTRGFSSSWCKGVSLWWPLLLQNTGCRACGLQWLWHVGLLAPWHVRSSLTRDQTRAPCIGRRILNHWTTREVQNPESFLKHQLACEWMDLLYYQGPWCWRFHWKGCGFWPCYLLLEHVRGRKRACVSFPFEFSVSPWKHCMDCHQINHNVLILNKKLSWT